MSQSQALAKLTHKGQDMLVRGLTEQQWSYLRNWCSQLYMAYLGDPMLAATFKDCWYQCHANYVECTGYHILKLDRPAWATAS